MAEFNFGRRKVGRMNYTYRISLPLPWVKNNKLEDRRAEIEMFMDEKGYLVLRPVLEEVSSE